MQNSGIQTKIPLSGKVNKTKFYLASTFIQYNNPLFKARLFKYFDCDIQRFFECDEDDIKLFAESPYAVTVPRNFLVEKAKINPDKIFEEVQNMGLKFITFEDDNYPCALKEIEDFPLMLYYKGSFENVNFDRAFAIVGSRNATQSARENVRRIVSGFANTDVVIVSGLASGIDTAAHTSALEAGIKTVAVIGSGLDFKYPSQNSKLYDEIENGNGLILSEFPNNLRPSPVNFPQRNRIVTGLSKGVLIAEAKKKSGAMISARFALEQGRDLMCIPGLITNPNCEGVYHLIKNGAGIVTETDDVLSALGWDFCPADIVKEELFGLEKDIFEAISAEEISIEGLKQKLDVGINELLIKLTEMELKGLIIQRSGLYYIPGN